MSWAWPSPSLSIQFNPSALINWCPIIFTILGKVSSAHSYMISTFYKMFGNRLGFKSIAKQKAKCANKRRQYKLYYWEVSIDLRREIKKFRDICPNCRYLGLFFAKFRPSSDYGVHGIQINLLGLMVSMQKSVLKNQDITKKV